MKESEAESCESAEQLRKRAVLARLLAREVAIAADAIDDWRQLSADAGSPRFDDVVAEERRLVFAIARLWPDVINYDSRRWLDAAGEQETSALESVERLDSGLPLV